MKLKTLVIIVVVLAGLSAVAYFANRPSSTASADARVNQPLVDRGTVEKAEKLKLSDQGKTVLLTKAADGSWRVNSFYDFPTDFQKLSRFVDDLTSAKVERLVTSNPDKISRLEFKDTQVTLLDPSDKPLSTLTLGKNFESGGRFVRFADEQKAYLTNLSAYLDTDAKNWADSTLVSVKTDDIAKIEITFPDAPTVIASRGKKEDAFSAAAPPAGQQLSPAKITGLLGSLTSIHFSDTSEPNDEKATAAKAHARTLKLTRFDGQTVTIELGRKPEEKIVKTPAATADGKSGPAAVLGSVNENKKPEESGPAKVAEPTTETIPAGPVYAFVSDSASTAPINALMQKRSFQVYESSFTSLPQKPADLFEPVPASATATPSSSQPSAAPKP
jgi:hypothetical protein